MAGETATVIEGEPVLLEHGLARTSVRFEDGLVTGLDAPRDGARVVDGSGLILAPAMVDIHGDAFERQLMPRPGVALPVVPALLETDRQLAANGIATAFHALTLGWEPGLCSVETGRAVVEGLAREAGRLTVENRVQLRWETFCFEAVPLIEAALAGPWRCRSPSTTTPPWRCSTRASRCRTGRSSTTPAFRWPTWTGPASPPGWRRARSARTWTRATSSR